MSQADAQREALLLRCEELGRGERWSEAERLLLEGLTRFPDDPELLLRLGGAQAVSAPDEAAATLRRAAALAPDDPDHLTRAASFAIGLSDVQLTSTFLQQAFRAAPDLDFELADVAACLGGRVAAASGDDAQAERLLRGAVAMEPEDGGHGIELARFLVARGRRGEALAEIDQALARETARTHPALRALRDELSA